MIRVSTIFIAICMVLIAASLGFLLYSLAGFTMLQSGLVALAALTFQILYNAATMRVRSRDEIRSQIKDVSRGTVELARQVAELNRSVGEIQTRLSTTTGKSDRIQALGDEIGVLGTLVKHLAASVASHDETLATVTRALAARPVPVAQQAPSSSAPVAPAAEAKPPEAPVSASKTQLVETVKNAVAANRLDIFLQPMVTLPQRKVRYYEAVSRLRDDKEKVLAAADFIGAAEAAGLMGQIDHIVLLRCVQVLRRLMVRNKDVGIFCNISSFTLSSPASFSQCRDFLEANRALAPSLLLEFRQSTFRHLGPVAREHLAQLARLGFGFSIDNVSDLKIDARELADQGVKFVKVPASLLLDQKTASSADIAAADLSDLLGRFGIDLVAERIEGERSVVDLLDYDIRFGQGFLFSPPRPVRPESAATEPAAPAVAAPAPAVDGVAAKTEKAPLKTGVRAESSRATGNAALVRRAAAQK